ncbi:MULTISPECIES: amino acid ABC transporter permease [Desulfococcus]|jgi:polar amino acid transport system permease protein|uniref:Putative glutamine transport system permease protein GlnP n=1 Tax=Desulfococcus multivorans DSM 2059 TaxID=1121405 RepID=S7TKC4_DESML|nr:amino acid ABC transporter permease [Desulfococcus multivorans]AOY57999.1 GlnM: glutamine ABC transporter permease protein [Desulfococcus multivorans]AQV00364.1 ABC transporter permease [Desulfococcus multivorans]EPR37296.1 polar amino acid ABC transporter, inner membrane subunit [Desulfococcus multivorans DSM 2059]MDX9817609.1 amino acid ABC transporter permease [Desulfococcus multivorans]SJZ70007.1 amino acid ABC transporter membrane protein, PAAT family [Desulfococcus multivorans DSM 205
MNSTLTLQKLRQKRSYFTWATVFFLLLAAAIAGLYYAAAQIDYVWRWYRIPRYFYYQEDIEIRSEIAGEVTAITYAGDGVSITVKGDNGEETYSAPTRTVQVSDGDLIFVGDTLASYKTWKVGILLLGLWITIKVSLIAIFFGILIGVFAGLARISTNPALKWSAITYIELIRGSPLLVQIFIWYFVLGTLINTLLIKQQVGITIPPLWFGVAALAFFTGAYVAEMVRAGIQSIHRGQTEAARSLGMTYGQTMVHVILPQAMRRILPPLAGQFISLIKDSSLLGIIAIRELSKATREVVTTSLQPFELWFVCALLYLVLTFSLSMWVQYLERRTLV